MPLPSISNNPIAYGKVMWTAIVSVLDSVDPDDIPDLDELEGNIIFKPSARYLKTPASVPPLTIALMNRNVSLEDSQIDEQGRKFIKLEASSAGVVPDVFTWTATFNLSYKGVMVSIPDTTFQLLPDDEIDLTDYIAPAAPVAPVSPTIDEIFAARNQAVAARDDMVTMLAGIGFGSAEFASITRDYGALNDGSGNATGAFAAALAELSQGGGGTLIVPPGVYSVDTVGLVDPVENVDIISPYGSAFIRSRTDAPPLSGSWYRSSISGLIFDAYNLGGYGANVHMVESKIMDCTFMGWTGRGMSLNDGTYGDLGLLNYILRNHIIQSSGIGIFQTYRFVDSWIDYNNVGSTDANISLEGGPLRVGFNHFNGAPLRNIDLRGNRRITIVGNIGEGAREEAVRYVMPPWLTEDSPQVQLVANSFSNGGKAAAGVHPAIRIQGRGEGMGTRGFLISANNFGCEDAGSGWSNIVHATDVEDLSIVGNQWEGAYMVSPLSGTRVTNFISSGNSSGNT
ncbi:minor tail protein [Gordonia phage FelixAlejandro]|nr:minor tail protein [Gordonia phage FelixAlejandro]